MQDEASGSPPRGPLPAGDAATNRALYERIQAPFDASRSAPWPPVKRFLEALPPSLVLDLAAGNARHAIAAARAGHTVIAMDIAASLLRTGARRARAEGLAVQGVIADMAHVPIRDNAFPVILFIAALHCLRGRAARREALRELGRIGAPGAHLLITVWERDEARFRAPLRRATVAAAAPDEPPIEPGDVDLPWTHGLDASVPRFFHLYEADELVADLEAARLKEIHVARARLGRGGTWNLIATARKAQG